MWDVQYRPMTFDDVMGQPGAVSVLKARLRNGSGWDTSYLFSGFHGSGKTTLARILARALLCQNLRDDQEPCNECDNCKSFLDKSVVAYTEMDAASQGTIDNVRTIVSELPFAVFNARKRIFTFDEAHRMSRDSQDCLLKPIEDKAMVAIFCTTEPDRIRGTIRSRCEEHAIRRISREDILLRMKKILAIEGVEHEDDAVLTLIDYCGAHVRDVLNGLETLAQTGPITVSAVRESLHLGVTSIYYNILSSLDDPAKALDLAESACDRVGPDEVASGLSEAAMDTYRISHGMFVSMLRANKECAQAVNARFGDGVIRLAEHFSRLGRPTRTGLMCGILTALDRPLAPPALYRPEAPAAALPANPVQAAPPQPVQPAAQTPQAGVQAPPAAQATPVPTQPPPSKITTGRTDGVGNRNSGDTYALTDLDEKAVPHGFPRGTVRGGDQGPTAVVEDHGTQGDRPLAPEQWRNLFRKHLKGLVG